jgi:hypothetical protein
MKTKITLSFKGKNQLPWFMITKEYWKKGEVVFAEVLFEIWPTRKRYIERRLGGKR